MMEKWMLYTKKADFNAWANALGVSPVAARIIRNRDVETIEEAKRYLFGTLDELWNPHLLPDMDLAVSILQEKIAAGKWIRIVGDYDIDGVCSTYILYQGLSRLGAKVDYEIPDRVKDGYGINESIIEAAAADDVDTILTCDNGIAAIDQIALGKRLGMTIVVTDHHDIQTEELADGTRRDLLPPADALVNPKRSDNIYPYESICGAMVAYKLIQVLYENGGVGREEWLTLLEFAAIATVGDVMPLKDENRIVVREGLKRMGRTENLGLRKLMEHCGLDAANINAYHIGFVIGPCLNAGGRLQTAKMALRLLLSKNEQEADELAAELKSLNDVRKDMTQKGVEDARELVEECFLQDSVLVVFLPECHESLAGIVAGRIREQYHKPTLILTRAEGGAKGSGRSIEAYHMFEGLVEVKDLLTKFGGHPMAAGFSLPEESVSEFRRRLNENAKLTPEDFIPKVWIDVALPFEYVTEELIEELERLEPFGQGNEKPSFAQKDLTIRFCRVFGKNRNVVKLTLVNERGCSLDAVIFTDGDQFEQERAGRCTIDIIYYPTINEYNGKRSVQLVIKHWKLH